ncbi:MAG: RNA-binding domain-containing protein [Thermoplasmata archaeon]
MHPEIKFLSIRLRAFAQATEVEERVLEAMAFASGTRDMTITRTAGHFGNSITVIEAELTKSGDMKRFLNRIRESGILKQFAGQEDARISEDRAFHFRLDKQKVFNEELALARNRDVIDVRLKIGVYPARRGDAVKKLSEWIAEF